MLIDSHIHLSRRQFEGEVPCIASSREGERIVRLNREGLIRKLQAEGIGCILEPAVELESNAQLLQLAKDYPEFVYPAVGVHPTRSFLTPWAGRKQLEEFSKDQQVIAIGELGLDYHYERREQHRLRQTAWFLWQLELAHRRKLPLVLHIRLADDDAIRILRLYRKKLHGGVCHCFSRGPEYADIYTRELGLCLGIGGALLQENAQPLEEAVRQTPLEYLLLETDGPYVKPARPEEISGKQWKRARNTSLILPDIAEKIARLKEIPTSQVEQAAEENFRRVFGVGGSV